MYDVLVDFFIARILNYNCILSIAPSDLARTVLSLLALRVVQGVYGLTRGDDYSAAGTISYLESKWRFTGLNHPYLSVLIRRTFFPAVRRLRSVVLVIHRKKRPEEQYSRSFANVDDIVEYFRKKGAPALKVVLEDLTLQDQMSLFAHSLGVVSTHGSGLFWLNFCKPRTPVVEVATPYFRTADGVKPDFWYISQAHGLFHVSCVADQVLGDAESPTNHDVQVNPEVLWKLFTLARNMGGRPRLNECHG